MLLVQNRQRKTNVNTRLLRGLTRALLRDCLRVEQFELAVYIVSEREMTRLNERHLRHAGSTDVITFDYGRTGPEETLVGELFVCIDEAQIQAVRYRATWQRELTRYVIHGALHLLGYDDQNSAARKLMKREENRWLKALDAQFNLAKLAGPSAVKLPQGRGSV